MVDVILKSHSLHRKHIIVLIKYRKEFEKMYNYYNYPCQNIYPWYRQQDRMYNRQRMYNPYNNLMNPDFNNYPRYPTYPDYPYNQESFYSPWSLQYPSDRGFIEIKDYGPNPFVINIEEATEQNNTFRSTLWTGDHLQLTLMSLNPGEDIGLEMHPDVDQFIRIEEGRGIVQMGGSEDNLDFEEMVSEDFIFIIPAGKWHNLTNIGRTPLKVYSIYAPPEHPHGTVHETKAEAEAVHGN
jgi:mannose-6-phosphate isomerase-like protein (cupin superfamily)